MKIKGNLSNCHSYAYPMQAALITCNDKNNKTNIITLAWHTNISKKPPLYAISVAPSRYSHRLIKDSKEFVINFAPKSIIEKVHFCGTHSGRKTDKIKDTNLTLENIEDIKTPIIKECYAHLACKLFKAIELGDHTLFVGEVISVISDENAFTDDVLNNEIIEPCCYLGNNFYTTINKNKVKF